MRTRSLAALAVLATLVGPAVACAQPARFYDPSALLVSLRPPVRTDLARAAHVARLEDLPLYDLQLTLDDTGNTFTLHEEVWFTNTGATLLSELVFRVYANVMPAPGAGASALVPGLGTPPPTVLRQPPVAFVRGGCLAGPQTAGACVVGSEAPSVIAVHPATPVAPGGHLRVELVLRGIFPQIDASRTNVMAQGMESLSMLSAGETGGDYGILATGDGIFSLGNFYPVLARRNATGWERTDSGSVGDLGSDDLAHVHAIVDTAPGMTVATTGVPIRTVTLPAAPGVPSRQRIEVAAAGVRDSAVMAGRTLQVATRRVGDVEVRSLFLPADRVAGERVLDFAAGALTVYEHRFGPYPYVDLDVVEAPLVGGAGGVEFPGLVTVASMFYRAPGGNGGSGAGGGGGGLLSGLNMGAVMGQMLPAMLEFTTAHEVAHQYWHALVGSDSREHPFVDESLAQWSASLYLEDRYGAARARHDGDMQIKMNYQFMRMLGQADAPVDRPASAFASPIAYAGLVYGKGPYLYNALRAAAGDAAFFRGVRRYVDTWRFRMAPPDGFTDALATEVPHGALRLRAIAQRWLRETHGDEDLGQADLGSLLAGVLGGGANGANGTGGAGGTDTDPDVQNLLRELGPLLGNGGVLPGGAPPPGGAAGTPGQPGNTQQDVQGLLQQALQQLGGM